MCEDWRTGYIRIRSANPLTQEESYLLLRLKAFTIGSMSADPRKQIGIRQGATPFNMITVFINLKLQELKG
jgi:hypothetical protein